MKPARKTGDGEANTYYAQRSRIVPPRSAYKYRRWSVWYEAGDFEHGVCYRETAWYAQSPAGRRIRAPDWSSPPARRREGDGNPITWLRGEIDRLEDEAK